MLGNIMSSILGYWDGDASKTFMGNTIYVSKTLTQHSE